MMKPVQPTKIEADPAGSGGLELLLGLLQSLSGTTDGGTTD